MAFSEIWAQWDDVNSSAEQQTRIGKATKADMTPLHLDSVNGTGEFQGSGHYSTSLSSCNCRDFILHKRPCKHMYRLAMELGCMEQSFKSDKNQIPVTRDKAISLEEAVSNIESLPVDIQIFLKNILEQFHHKQDYAIVDKCNSLDVITQQSFVYESLDYYSLLYLGYRRNELNNRIAALGIPFKKNMRSDILAQWAIDNIPNDKLREICNDKTTVIIHPKYKLQRTKLYTYLHRKFDSTSVLSMDLSSQVALLETTLPDDIVTDLLRKNGHYK